MNDTSDTGHLDLEALADVLAGDDAAHAAECATCAARLSELRAALVPVAATLRDLPEPQLPAAVGEQLSRAINHERATLRLGRGSGRPTTTVVPQRTKRTNRWRALGPALAAAAAVVVVGVLVSRGGGGHPSTTADRSAGITTHVLSSGLDYAKDGKELKAALPALLSGSPSAVAQLQRPATGSQLNPAQPRATPADQLARLRGTAALAACITAISDVNDPRPPLAIDYASFEGSPALIVLLATDKPTKVDAWVVGPGCSQADAKVLFFMRLTRPA